MMRSFRGHNFWTTSRIIGPCGWNHRGSSEPINPRIERCIRLTHSCIWDDSSVCTCGSVCMDSVYGTRGQSGISPTESAPAEENAICAFDRKMTLSSRFTGLFCPMSSLRSDVNFENLLLRGSCHFGSLNPSGNVCFSAIPVTDI